MEIQSPGKLPNIVTLDNMCNTRYSRNPGIARVLAEMGWVRELNEGVQRIYDEMQGFFLHGPIFSEPNDASVMLILENSITSRVMRRDDALAGDLGQEVLDGLNEYELAALKYIYAKGRNRQRTLRSARSQCKGCEASTSWTCRQGSPCLAWVRPKGSFAALHTQVSSANVESASLYRFEWD